MKEYIKLNIYSILVENNSICTEKDQQEWC